MNSPDKTKEILEQILAQLYSEQANESKRFDGSYLLADDGQLLGKITNSRYETDSILNEYGPYGSRYSNTSIFNPYSPYGSVYGQYSVFNPYCSVPPRLFIAGKVIGRVTANRYISDGISPEAFISSLRNDLSGLLAGNVLPSDAQVRKLRAEPFIEAADGTFLGTLNLNSLDRESVFNTVGPYGSQFSPTSIYNQFSKYGGQFSNLSPFNAFCQTPPKVFVGGEFSSYITSNKLISPRIDPQELRQWAERHAKYRA